jgi:hypothetical protein
MRRRGRLRERLRAHVRDLENKAGVILFLAACFVGTVAVLIFKAIGG